MMNTFFSVNKYHCCWKGPASELPKKHVIFLSQSKKLLNSLIIFDASYVINFPFKGSEHLSSNFCHSSLTKKEVYAGDWLIVLVTALVSLQAITVALLKALCHFKVNYIILLMKKPCRNELNQKNPQWEKEMNVWSLFHFVSVLFQTMKSYKCQNLNYFIFWLKKKEGTLPKFFEVDPHILALEDEVVESVCQVFLNDQLQNPVWIKF